MKIDCSQEIHTLKGIPFKDAEGKNLTLGDVIAEVLAMDEVGGKMKLFTLAQKAYGSGDMEVDAADLSLIKKSFEKTKAYNGNALVLGQAQKMLEEVKE